MYLPAAIGIPIHHECAGIPSIETGIGAAVAGAASGMAVGAVTGPVGAAIGAAVGAVAGGYAGKGVGELIDPTTEDNWLPTTTASRPYVRQGDTFETHFPPTDTVPKPRLGTAKTSSSSRRRAGKWLGEGKRPRRNGMDRARGAVKDAYDRSCHIRKQKAAGTWKP